MQLFRLQTSQEAAWDALRTFCAVRFVLSIVAAVAMTAITPNYLGGMTHGSSASWFSLAYSIFTLASLGLTFVKRPYPTQQFLITLVVDLVFIPLLVVLSDGVRGGLTILYFAPVAGAALLGQLPVALSVAALASLIMLGDTLLRQFGRDADPAYFQTGALSAAMFAVALVLNRLAARVETQEALVRRKNAELRAQIQINRAVINEMRHGVLVVSPDGQVRAANPAARTVLQADSLGDDAELGRWLADNHPRLATVLASWARNHARDSRTWRVVIDGLPTAKPGEFSATSSPPRRRSVRLRLIPFGDPKAKDVPLLVSIEDLQELETQAMQLKLASMGRLSASIAHEIRNPLAAIGHASALLSEEQQTAGAQRLLRIVQDNVRRLDRIVEDVLSVSRSSRIERETCKLSVAVRQIVDEFTRSQGVPLERIVLDVAVAIEVQFDRAHLTQILVNLLANAVRYGTESPGAVEVTADRRNDGSVELTVSDDGPGIEQSVRKQLFEPFFTTHRKGTGLGLYLARELALANGAELTLGEDERRTGASFTLRILPAREEPPLSADE